jgi:hypothetical protein
LAISVAVAKRRHEAGGRGRGKSLDVVEAASLASLAGLYSRAALEHRLRGLA